MVFFLISWILKKLYYKERGIKMENKLIEILVNWYDIDCDKINIKHSFVYKTGPEDKPDVHPYYVSLDMHKCPILIIKPNRKLKFDVIKLSVTSSGRIKIVDTMVLGGFNILNACDSIPSEIVKKYAGDYSRCNIIHEVLEILNKRMMFLDTPENRSILTKMVEVCNSIGEFGCASSKGTDKEYIMTRTKGNYGFSSNDYETKPTTPPDKDEKPTETATSSEKSELNAIMNELKLMASQFNIPIITGHQLNREDAISEENKTKTTSSLNKREPVEKERLSKIEYYLDIASAVAERGTCLRRKFGAIIVNNDRIVSTGYVGAPRGRENCCDRGKCFRVENNIPSGQRYELCRSVHAEMNAIINASKEEMEGSTLYLVGIENDSTFTKNAEPCSMCKRMIINAGITNVIVRTTNSNGICSFKKFDVSEWVSNDDSLNLHEGY